MSKLNYYDDYLELIKNGKPISREVNMALKRIPYYLEHFDYDSEYVDKIIKFIETMIYLQKGDNSKKPMKLQTEQKFWISLMGFKHPNNTPVISDIGLILGAGSGKSTFMAALAIAVMMVGSYKGNDALILANSVKQSQETFRTATEMVGDERSPLFFLKDKEILKPITNAIKYSATNSIFQVKTMDNKTADGVNVRLAIFDEFHSYRTNVIENIRKSSAPKRVNTGFTIWFISTNGQTRDNVFDDYYKRWEDILAGRITDWSTFPLIYKVDDVSEVSDTSKYEKAMPFIRSISDPEIVHEMLVKSEGNPVAQAEILAKSFNLPQREFNSLFTNAELKRAYEARPQVGTNNVYVGYDLSAVNDLSALSFLKKENDELVIDSHAFLPKYTYEHHASPEQVQVYQTLIDQGSLTLIDGNMISEQAVFDWLVQYLHDNDLNPLGFAGDAYYAKDFKRMLGEYYGESMVHTVAQNVANLSDPLKKIKGHIQSGHTQLTNQLLTWSFANLRVKIDANGNMYPNKSKAVDKIDPAVATIEAYWLYANHEADEDLNIWANW